MSIIRIKFAKSRDVRFISHLDMMKTFQRAVRRSGLEAEYSGGFNPQMQMVFAAPLSLGFSSNGEYADLTFKKEYELEYIIEVMKESLPVGIPVIAAGKRKISKNIMADISYAMYDFKFECSANTEKLIASILESKELYVQKERKGRVKKVDIRPLIMKIDFKDGRIYTLVNAGNEINLNPKLMIEAINFNFNTDASGTDYHRSEQFVARNGKILLPLDIEALETE